LDDDELDTGAETGTEDDLDTATGSGIEDDLNTGAGTEDDLSTTAGSEDDTPVSTPRGRRTRRTLLGRTASILSNYSTLLSPRRDSSFVDDKDEEMPTTHSSPLRSSHEARSFTSSTLSNTPVDDLRSISSIYSAHSTSTLNPGLSVGDSASTRGGTWPRQNSIPNTKSRPFFFQPSELEEIMAPVKADFMQKQADKLEQAKAAYEQLNEQLMSELPQLIDLRYVTIKTGGQTVSVFAG
jgi:hypothetical protein